MPASTSLQSPQMIFVRLQIRWWYVSVDGSYHKCMFVFLHCGKTSTQLSTYLITDTFLVEYVLIVSEEFHSFASPNTVPMGMPCLLADISVVGGRGLKPLLLTWFNFNPSMDK